MFYLVVLALCVWKPSPLLPQPPPRTRRASPGLLGHLTSVARPAVGQGAPAGTPGPGEGGRWALEPHPISSSRRQTPACTHRGSWGRRTRVRRRTRGRGPGSCTPGAPRSLPGGRGGKARSRPHVWASFPEGARMARTLPAAKPFRGREPVAPTLRSALLALACEPRAFRVVLEVEPRRLWSRAFPRPGTCYGPHSALPVCMHTSAGLCAPRGPHLVTGELGCVPRPRPGPGPPWPRSPRSPAGRAEAASYRAEAAAPAVPATRAEHGRAELAPPGAVAGVQAQHADLSLHQPWRQVLEVGYGAPAGHPAPRPHLEGPGVPARQRQQPHGRTQGGRAVQLQGERRFRACPQPPPGFLPRFTHHDTRASLGLVFPARSASPLPVSPPGLPTVLGQCLRAHGQSEFTVIPRCPRPPAGTPFPSSPEVSA